MGASADYTNMPVTANTRNDAQCQCSPAQAEQFQKILEGAAGRDDLKGGDGSDFLDGGKGVDTLQGGGGSDIIVADNFGDEVRGGSGDDFIFSSNNVGIGTEGGIPGAHGELRGGSGDDTYVLGNGAHVINDGAGSDTISLNGTQADFDFSKDGDDVVIRSNDTSVRITGQFEANNGVEKILFADGTERKLSELLL